MTGAEGAVVTFEGTVRNNTRAGARCAWITNATSRWRCKTMARIGREIAAAFAGERVAMVHRLGRLLVGETSVAVIVTAPHRRPAFEAALEGINRLKKRVPIWKKEHFVDGEVWVEGEWDRNVPVARLVGRLARHSCWRAARCWWPAAGRAGARDPGQREPGAGFGHGEEPRRPTGGLAGQGRLRDLRQRRAAGHRRSSNARPTSRFRSRCWWMSAAPPPRI